MVYNIKRGAFLLSTAAILLTTACSSTEDSNSKYKGEVPDVLPLTANGSSKVTPESVEIIKAWTDEELWAMAQTLSGECYDDKEQDKRLVCEVILNRVSDGHFGNSIISVITAKDQFPGYQNPSRTVSENDLTIAEQTLKDWFDNDCKPLSKYLYFSTGKNHENTFYENIE